jgi:hypothetical protein
MYVMLFQCMFDVFTVVVGIKDSCFSLCRCALFVWRGSVVAREVRFRAEYYNAAAAAAVCVLQVVLRVMSGGRPELLNEEELPPGTSSSTCKRRHHHVAAALHTIRRIHVQ